MTPDTDAAFLAAIASNPDDGLVRLVYADWLDEQGRPEADFLRTEHELTAVSPDQPRWHELFRRYQAIGHGLPSVWCAVVRRHPMDHWLRTSARGAWRRLEKWCEQHHPRLLETLNPGATEAEIAAVEETIGQPLPADVRESFAIHNGESGYHGFLLGYTLQDHRTVIHDWRELRSVDSYNEEFRRDASSSPPFAIALDFFNKSWISLSDNGGGNSFGVDLAPGPAGVMGQVINFGKYENQKCVLASGWAEFLADCASFLESGAMNGIDPKSEEWEFDWEDIRRAVLGPHGARHTLPQWRREGRWPIRPTT